MPLVKIMRKNKKSPRIKKNPVGRPLVYKTPEKLEKRINRYFKTEAYATIGSVDKDSGKQKVKKYAPTISGLVLYCGFCDRHAFNEYEKRSEFSAVIKRARCRIEQYYERLLQGSTPTGAIFALKNFGWVDEQKLSHILNGYLFVENEGKSVEDLQRESIRLAEEIIANRRGTPIPSQN